MKGQDRYYRPNWNKYFVEVLTVAESTRLGGVGQAPFKSLNLGLYTKDDDTVVKTNRALFCEALGWSSDQLAGAHQVHGAEVLRVHGPGQREGYDALITNKKGVLLSVTVADCTPVLIYDPVKRAVGAAHAGWRGTVAGIAGKTLRYMRDAYGTRPENCWAYVGTCIGLEDFEVDEDVARHFAVKYCHWNAERQKYLIDLKAANADVLRQLGVQEDQLEISPFSTVKNVDRYFSHRAEHGKTGRMLAVIGVK